MDRRMEAEWNADKRALFDAVLPYSGAGAVPGPSPGGAMSPYTARGTPGSAVGECTNESGGEWGGPPEPAALTAMGWRTYTGYCFPTRMQARGFMQ